MRWRGGETGLALLVTSPEGLYAGSEKGEEKVTGLHWTLPVGGAEAGLHASARCAWGQAQLVKHLWLSDSPKCFVRLEMSPDCNVPSTGYVRLWPVTSVPGEDAGESLSSRSVLAHPGAVHRTPGLPQRVLLPAVTTDSELLVLEHPPFKTQTKKQFRPKAEYYQKKSVLRWFMT